MSWVWILFAVLVLIAALRFRRRMAARRARASGPIVDDDAIRRILEDGALDVDDEDDEPLDLDEIAREEAEFWEESWDEPEEYGGR
jgi:hypothetical protein